ncbi:MAG: L,D-transpeptidase family protein [Planctomycetota bacterium]
MLRFAASLALVFPAPAACPAPTVDAREEQEVRATPASSPRARLAPFFSRANADPAGIVPLILEGSATLDERDGRLLADTLEPYCSRAFFSPERLPGMEKLGLALHKVRAGEVPERIARRYKTGAGLFEYLNEGYDERRLREGQALKVLDLSSGPVEIEVRRGAYRLAVYRVLPDGGRALVMFVPVGLGAPDSPTPLGKTSITLRARNPEWTDPVTKTVYPPGDPGNVLGGYWIALDSEGIGRKGIGLHGYTGDVAANWIEQPASQGCVRMLQRDIDRVFHLAVEGTRVTLLP